MSCGDGAVCEATGSGSPWRSTDGGATWVRGSYPSLPGQGLGRTALSCRATATCVLADSLGLLLTTNDAGVSWAVTVVPRAYDQTQDLACQSTRRCVALVTSAVATTTALITDDGGVTWTSHPIPVRTAMATLTDLQCPSLLVCYARGGYGYPDSDLFKSVDGARSWRLVHAPALVGLSCMSATTCVGVNRSLWVTTDGGASWQAHPAPPFDGPGESDDVVCGSLNNCVVTHHANHKTWLAYTGDLGLSYGTTEHDVDLAGLTCQGLTCYAAVNSPAVLTSTDGGQSWTSQSLPASLYVRDIACCLPRRARSAAR